MYCVIIRLTAFDPLYADHKAIEEL